MPRSGANVEEGPKGGRLTKRKDRWLNSTHLPFMEDGCRKAHGDYSDEDEIEIAKQSKENSRIPPGKGASTPDGSKKVRNTHAVASAVDDERETDDEAPAMKETVRRMSTSTKQGPKDNGAPVAQTDASVDAASPSADPKDVAHDIQILELHNKNPIIIYRNQQFRCDWAENIGTELLFIKHSDVSANPEGHLPVVREMPGEVDLLAVSGVRVMGNPINIRAKQRVIEKGKGRAYKSTKDRPVRIPIGMAAREDRKAQARFLEMLQDIKVIRGEDDEVTVNAVPRKENRARKDRARERKRQQKFINSQRTSEHQIVTAKAKIAELDALDDAGDGGPRRRRNKIAQRQKRGRIDEAEESLMLESLGVANGSNKTKSDLRAADGTPLDGQNEPNISQDEDEEDEEDDSDSDSASSSDDSESTDLDLNPDDDDQNSYVHGNEQDMDLGDDDGRETYPFEYDTYDDYDMDSDEEGYYTVDPESRDVDVDMNGGA